MNRPKESEYASHVAYSRDLETYVDALEAALCKAKETLMYYQYGGSSYKQQADKAIATINKVLGEE